MTETRVALWIFVAALVLRLGFVLVYPQAPFGLADDRGYDELGWSLASGTGFTLHDEAAYESVGHRVPAITIGPTYPVFLAAVYAVFGHHLTAVRVVQAILSAALVLLVWQVARAAGYAPRVALLSAELVALYPAFIIYSGVVLTEIVFAVCLVAAIWMVLLAIETGARAMWAVAGATIGIAVLVRSEAIVLVPMIAVAGLYASSWREAIAHGLLFVAAAGLVVGVWTVRNYSTFGELVPVSANGGRTLWISTKGWDEWRADDPELQGLIAGLGEVQIDRVLGNAAVRNIAAAPGRYVMLSLKRIPQFWLGSHTTYLRGFNESFRTYLAGGAYGRLLVKTALLAANLGVLLLGIAGAWRSLRTSAGRTVLLLVPIVGLAAVHVVLFATSRYQVPLMPFVLLFAAVSLASLPARRRVVQTV